MFEVFATAHGPVPFGPDLNPAHILATLRDAAEQVGVQLRVQDVVAPFDGMPPDSPVGLLAVVQGRRPVRGFPQSARWTFRGAGMMDADVVDEALVDVLVDRWGLEARVCSFALEGARRPTPPKP